MAVAAYASLLPWEESLDRLQQLHDTGRIVIDKEQVHHLQDKVRTLIQFLEVLPETLSEEIRTPIREIKTVVAEAILLIDAEVFDQLDGRKRDGMSSFTQNLNGVIGNLESMILDMNANCISNISPKDSTQTSPGSFSVMSRGERRVVGFEEKISWTKSKLTNHQKSLQCIPIVGMGGIGKTTLAEHIFNDPVIKRKFDCLLWCTVSRHYNLRQILQSLLTSLLGVEDKSNEENRELGQRLYQKLYSRKYLIVVDDIWSIDAWNSLRLFLPDKDSNSRVIVTTRFSNVAKSVSSHNTCTMNLLDEKSSWELLYQEIFNGQQDCPDDLETIGRIIAKNCKGLPLSLVAIGGLLSKSSMALEFWENVAENTREKAGQDGEHCMKVLSWSYNCLPIHLKPLFLYFRNCHEDEKIDVEEMIMRWIAEGFVKPMSTKLIEDAAYEYMKDLVDRNLILSKEHDLRYGEVREYCGIHDLLLELSINESEKESFLLIPRASNPHINNLTNCCMCGAHDCVGRMDISLVPKQAMSSLICCESCRMAYPHLGKSKFVNFSESGQNELAVCSTTRRLALFLECAEGEPELVFPLPIFHLWNLQVLYINYWTSSKPLILPVEIWDMQQLRHLTLERAILPEPGVKNPIVLQQIHTLRCMQQFGKVVFQRIPSIKHLCIEGTPDEDCLAGFHQLQVLRTSLNNRADFTDILPLSLKKLDLELRIFKSQEFGHLPNLEFLQLYIGHDEGDCVILGEFPRLKVFKLRKKPRGHFRIELDIDFPNLEKLVLRNLEEFEIPPCIEDLPILRSIHLSQCDEITIKSAEGLLEEQYSVGNDTLQLYVDRELIQVSDCGVIKREPNLPILL